MRTLRSGALSYDTQAAAMRSAVDTSRLPDMAVQSAAQDADINVIVRRFIKTGVIQARTGGVPLQEFVAPIEYRDALDQVRRADALFAELPAAVRKKFENSPAIFVEACQDPAKASELAALGLLDRAVSPPAEPSPAQGAPADGA